MLRILLIILVARAVIIGLMRLTGAKPGEAAPAAVSVGEPADIAVGDAAAEKVIIDEPAVDALDAPAAIEGDATSDVVEPAVEGIEGTASDAVEVLEEVPADAAAPPAANAAEPVEEPAPVIEQPAVGADPNTPGR